MPRFRHVATATVAALALAAPATATAQTSSPAPYDNAGYWAFADRMQDRLDGLWDDDAGYYRALGALAVATVLASLLQPIVRRLHGPPERRHELVLELDREPSEEAVAAAVETLAQHGIRAERR